MSEGGGAGPELLEGALHRTERVLEDLKQEEEQHSGGDAAQEGLEPSGPPSETAEGQAEEDREPRDGAEQDGEAGSQWVPFRRRFVLTYK